VPPIPLTLFNLSLRPGETPIGSKMSADKIDFTDPVSIKTYGISK
jgi:hypothetical protein